MKILITGSGKSGSWQIRAVQLGRAIGATVTPNADVETIAAHDLVILVKRPPAGLPERVRRAGRTLVYDIVDAWPQPEGNEWGPTQCRLWLAAQIKAIQPDALVAATHAMEVDCAPFRLPILTLPHHARPDQCKNPIRREVRTVGYEGGENYLRGRWRAMLETECVGRGWQFIVNPPALSDLDIVVALRDVSGYAPEFWKSNVKLANAQGSGTPVVCGYEAGYFETACGAEYFVKDRADLTRAFDRLTPQAKRAEISEQLWTAGPRLNQMANRYLEWIQQLKS